MQRSRVVWDLALAFAAVASPERAQSLPDGGLVTRVIAVAGQQDSYTPSRPTPPKRRNSCGHHGFMKQLGSGERS